MAPDLFSPWIDCEILDIVASRRAYGLTTNTSLFSYPFPVARCNIYGEKPCDHLRRRDGASAPANIILHVFVVRYKEDRLFRYCHHDRVKRAHVDSCHSVISISIVPNHRLVFYRPVSLTFSCVIHFVKYRSWFDSPSCSLLFIFRFGRPWTSWTYSNPA